MSNQPLHNETHDVNLYQAKNDNITTQVALNKIKDALSESHRLIRETQSANCKSPESNLQIAKNQLAYALQYINKIQVEEKSVRPILHDEIKQHLTHLTYQVEQAYHTVQVIEKELNPYKY